MSRNFRGASLEILDEDDELTDIPLSDTRPLPILPKHAVIENPQFLARSFHSQVYSVSYTDRTLKKRAILKIFPKGLKKRYTNEVNAYRFLNHFGAPAKGVVPRIYGVLPTINKKKLDDLLQDSVPDDVSISLPASGVLMEFIDGVRPNEENMRHSIAVKVLHALDIIHASHVLHGDVEPRNILLDERTGNAVWIDFSSARINKWVTDTMLERDKIKFTLYCTLV
jgi:serine/threonine protein kinase